MMVATCINADCGWTGSLDDCVHFKHSTSAWPLCPECHENVCLDETAEVTPEMWNALTVTGAK